MKSPRTRPAGTFQKVGECLYPYSSNGVYYARIKARSKEIRRSKPIRETPTFEEFRSIVADSRNQRFSNDAQESADFVEFLGLAGLGQAEATSLRWSDIDWERETMRTFRHKTQAGFVVPLYPQLKCLLERRKSKILSQNGIVFRVKSAKKAITSASRPPWVT